VVTTTTEEILRRLALQDESVIQTVIDALACGVTADEVVGALIAVAPIVGLARVTSATPAIAMAVGYDLDEAFEQIDVPNGADH